MKLLIHIDGGSRGNPGPAAAGVVIHDEHGSPVKEAGYFLGRMTNNQAEYHGLIRALEAAARLGGTDLTIRADSELLVRQVNGVYEVRNPGLVDLYARAAQALRQFPRWRIEHIYREANGRADELANAAMDAKADVDGRGGPKGKPAPSADRQESDGAPPVVVARCTKPPDASVCPAPCKQGRTWRFTTTVAGDVCLETALELLLAVREVAAGAEKTEAACPRDGCGAEFAVKRSER